jgi:6-phosphogluconolactonase (cycloisomerase 2 family)
MVQTNGANTVSITGNGTPNLATLPSGTVYTVTASAQPTGPSQTCTVGTPHGTLTANVNLAITCVTNTYAISANVSGLSGASTGLVLALNATSNPVIHASGTVALTPVLASGATYTVTVVTQPSTPTQSCLIPNPTGPVTNAPITVAVNCTTVTGTVGGTISGLGTATGLVLKDTVSGNTATVPASSTTFAIGPAVNSGSLYTVVVMTQPATPAEYCTVTPATASGTVTTGNVTSVTVTCRKEGRYAFVADNGGNTVYSYAIDDSNGATAGDLTAINSAALAVGAAPVAIAVNPTGTNVYTADSGTADVTVFSVIAGAVAAVGVAPTGITGSTPTGLAIDPSGRFLLLTDSESGAGGAGNGVIVVYSISAIDGSLTQIAASPFLTADLGFTGVQAASVAVDPTDKYVYATNEFDPALGLAGFTIDTSATATAGDLTAFSPTWQVPTGNNPIAVTIDPLSRFVYVSDSSDGEVAGWTIGAGGALTAMAGSPFPIVGVAGTTGGIAIDPSGQFLYVTDSHNGVVVAYTINQTTGVLTPFTTGSPFAAAGGATPVSIDPSGHFLYVGNTFADSISMYAVNTTTGALVPLAASPLIFPGLGPNAIAIE